jgi:hypothetical protein
MACVFEWRREQFEIGERCGHILFMSIFEVASEAVQRGILMGKLRAWMVRMNRRREPSE